AAGCCQTVIERLHMEKLPEFAADSGNVGRLADCVAREVQRHDRAEAGKLHGQLLCVKGLVEPGAERLAFLQEACSALRGEYLGEPCKTRSHGADIIVEGSGMAPMA